MVYSLVFRTEVFVKACRNWKRSNTDHRTWTNFENDFGLAFKELRKNQVTSVGTGFDKIQMQYNISVQKL